MLPNVGYVGIGACVPSRILTNDDLQQVVDTSDDVLSLSAADYDQDGWLDLYVGVSAGAFIAASIANRIYTEEL